MSTYTAQPAWRRVRPPGAARAGQPAPTLRPLRPRGVGEPQPMAGRPFGQSRRARPHARPWEEACMPDAWLPERLQQSLAPARPRPAPPRHPGGRALPRAPVPGRAPTCYSTGPARGPLRLPAKAGLKKWRAGVGWRPEVWLLGCVPPVPCHVHSLPPALRVFEAKGLEICSDRFGPRGAVRLPFHIPLKSSSLLGPVPSGRSPVDV